MAVRSSFSPQLPATQFCELDGFPLLEIDGKPYCSVEYADGLIGGQSVIGVWEESGAIRLLFSGGWSLPLTCPCCGSGLHLRPRTLADVRLLLTGRALEGFRHGEWVGRGAPPARHPVFALQFAGTEERKVRTVELSLESVRGLRREQPAAVAVDS